MFLTLKLDFDKLRILNFFKNHLIQFIIFIFCIKKKKNVYTVLVERASMNYIMNKLNIDNKNYKIYQVFLLRLGCIVLDF